MSEKAPQRYRQVLQKVLIAYGSRLELFDSMAYLFDMFHVTSTPGHTPGHVFFTLREKDETIVFAGDFAHMASVQFRDPSISMTYDMVLELARQERERLMKVASGKGYLVAGAHLPFPGIGHIVSENTHYRFLPLPYRES